MKMTKHQLLEDLSDAEINADGAMAKKVVVLEERVQELERMLEQLTDRIDRLTRWVDREREREAFDHD